MKNQTTRARIARTIVAGGLATSLALGVSTAVHADDAAVSDVCTGLTETQCTNYTQALQQYRIALAQWQAQKRTINLTYRQSVSSANVAKLTALRQAKALRGTAKKAAQQAALLQFLTSLVSAQNTRRLALATLGPAPVMPQQSDFTS